MANTGVQGHANNTANNKVHLDVRNSNSHFQSGDSASLSHKSNEYLQKVGGYKNNPTTPGDHD